MAWHRIHFIWRKDLLVFRFVALHTIQSGWLVALHCLERATKTWLGGINAITSVPFARASCLGHDDLAMCWGIVFVFRQCWWRCVGDILVMCWRCACDDPATNLKRFQTSRTTNGFGIQKRDDSNNLFSEPWYFSTSVFRILRWRIEYEN